MVGRSFWKARGCSVALSKQSQSRLVLNDWEWQSDVDGRWTWETIRTASQAESARRLVSIDSTLNAILRAINSLGSEGLHYILRDEAAKRRKAERLRRQRAAAKRRQAKAALEAARQ